MLTEETLAMTELWLGRGEGAVGRGDYVSNLMLNWATPNRALCILLTLRHHCSLKMSMEESISLEETNKIRISLGLKPLTDDKAPTQDKEKIAEENYAKKREEEAKARDAKYV